MERLRRFDKSYDELAHISDYFDRFEYLKLNGAVGNQTFGFSRYLNQVFYQSRRWRSVRSKVIIRDNGCDMAYSDRPIYGTIHIHHINPVTLEMLENEDSRLYDMNNLICVTADTHRAIHFGDSSLLMEDYKPRRPGDTKLW